MKYCRISYQSKDLISYTNKKSCKTEYLIWFGHTNDFRLEFKNACLLHFKSIHLRIIILKIIVIRQLFHVEIYVKYQRINMFKINVRTFSLELVSC